MTTSTLTSTTGSAPPLPAIAFNPHDNPQGPGDARPTADQIMLHEGGARRIAGKTVLITGASSGIGTETARVLYEAGAILYLPVRDVSRAKAAIDAITVSDRSGSGSGSGSHGHGHDDDGSDGGSHGRGGGRGGGRVHLLTMEMSELSSVRACAAEFLRQSSVLNLLICNAGVMATPFGLTVDGHETQFATNHLAHFLLFELLAPTMITSSTADYNSRVIALSSVGHRMSPVQLDDLNFGKSTYNKWAAYGQSKTANIWMALEIERRYGNQGLHALAVHPGGINTNLGRHMTEGFTAEEIASFGWNEDDMSLLPKIYKSVGQGAATTIYAAIGKDFEGIGGLYLAECGVTKPVAPERQRNILYPGFAPWAYDRDGAKRLYDISQKLVNSK